ncbi:MAG: tetratricopeptide repeat-containing protein [Saprospiraceae bacterium]
MAIPKILSDAAISVAKGISKVVLGKFLQSVKGGNKGAIIPYRSEGNENIVCFIHGFSGDPESTFKPIPEFIIAENELNGWDVLSIGYSTDLMPNIGKGIWAASPDILKIANYLQTNLDILFEHYNRVALIGHSMGGLVIQRAILNRNDIHKISHVLFYGTPSGGLRKAWFLRWFKNQISDMDYEGEFIKNLRNEWNERFNHKYPFKFATVAGELDEFVPINSSLEPFPKDYHCVTAGNHITMVKPETNMDTSFQVIKKMLCIGSEIPYLIGDDKELNNLIAKYYEEVDTLGKKLNDLDVKGFKRYIFALEGTDKIDEAIKVLEESEILNSNTDIMGILGGRLKRKYLIEESKTLLDKAIYWYDKALQLSLQSNNSSQIYYHAINLAFLYLMLDETDLTKTKEMAELALKNCQIAKGGEYWEDATIAEANLYLNDFEQSKIFYASAINKCNQSIRETSSMFINAVYACNSLNRLDWKKELEIVFNN